MKMCGYKSHREREREREQMREQRRRERLKRAGERVKRERE
jgi:hypothetical protein